MKWQTILFIFILVILSSSSVFGIDDKDAKAIEEMIDISPYGNFPQNKNIQNILKNKQSPLKIQQKKSKKEVINEEKLKSEDFCFKYKFYIDTKEKGKSLALEDLGINQTHLNELIMALKASDLNVLALQEIVNRVSYYFQYHGYPSATAYIPEQEITDTIQINIMIGKLGEYQVVNHSYLKDFAINSKLNNSLKGSPLRTKDLEDVIYKINEMSGVNAIGTLVAGSKYETTDVIIQVEDSIKANAMLFFDNYGLENVSVYRMGVSGTLNNLLGFGDSLNLFAQISSGIQKNYGVTYNTFLGNLKISPRANLSHYALNKKYASVGAYGNSLENGVDLCYPVFINRINSFYLTGGYIHKKLEDIYGKFGINFNKHSNSGYIGVEGIFGEIANNIFSYNAKITYGNVVPDSEMLGKNSMGEFWKFNAYLNNVYYFNKELTQIVKINFQKAIGKYEFDSSETASLGGSYGIRSYPNGFGESDNLILTTLGIRSNVPNSNFYVTPFYEFACGWNENCQNNFTRMLGKDDKNILFLDAAGLELLYMKANLFHIKLDLAKAITKCPIDSRRRDRLYTSFGIYF